MASTAGHLARAPVTRYPVLPLLTSPVAPVTWLSFRPAPARCPAPCTHSPPPAETMRPCGRTPRQPTHGTVIGAPPGCVKRLCGPRRRRFRNSSFESRREGRWVRSGERCALYGGRCDHRARTIARRPMKSVARGVGIGSPTSKPPHVPRPSCKARLVNSAPSYPWGRAASSKPPVQAAADDDMEIALLDLTAAGSPVTRRR